MSNDWSIVACGMVTAVGRHYEAACAAVRAGVSRPRPLQDTSAWDPSAEEEVAVIGHSVAGITDGRQGIGRQLALARRALEDLARPRTPRVESLAIDELVLCVPQLDAERFAFEDEQLLELARRLAVVGAVNVVPQRCRLAPRSRNAVIATLDELRVDRARRPRTKTLILAVDSWLDDDSLSWLLAHERLKTPEQPVGIAPGEAAVALIVEGPGSVTRAGATLIESTACEFERESPEAPPLGRNLTRALQRVLGTRDEVNAVGDMWCDLNGEVRRAHAWGAALAALGKESIPADAHMQIAALALGDTGVAGTSVAIAASVRAFERGYAHGERAVAWSLDDDGSAAACALRRAR